MSAESFRGAESTLIMGVLNITPDSFSDGGLHLDPVVAIARGRALVQQGASIVDVGGESTRPGAEPVSPETEQRRVLPVIEALAADGITVSIDTLHAETALAAVAAGARFVNDVSGGLHDPQMLETVAQLSAEHGTRFIIGHWRGVPDPGHIRSDYADVVSEVRAALAERALQAIAAGVAPHHIVLDPGLGFDKTAEQGWQLLTHLDQLTSLGHPVLIGASRKRMIGEALEALDDAPGEAVNRDLATAAVSALVAREGAWGVRVHDVSSTAAALAVARAWGAAGATTGASDRITLTGLEVFAHHGYFAFEREQGQRFVIDAEVDVDLRAAAAGDELAQTVNYAELAGAILEAAANDPVDLIETLAERVARVALGFAAVQRARITVHKPDAPIDATFGDVSVTIERGRL
jgi:dihydropteroate synthase